MEQESFSEEEVEEMNKQAEGMLTPQEEKQSSDREMLISDYLEATKVNPKNWELPDDFYERSLQLEVVRRTLRSSLSTGFHLPGRETAKIWDIDIDDLRKKMVASLQKDIEFVEEQASKPALPNQLIEPEDYAKRVEILRSKLNEVGSGGWETMLSTWGYNLNGALGGLVSMERANNSGYYAKDPQQYQYGRRTELEHAVNSLHIIETIMAKAKQPA